MNSLPAPCRQPSPRRGICRPNYLLPPPSRCFLYPGGHQLHYNHYQHEASRDYPVPNPSIRMSSPHHSRASSPISPCASCRHYNTLNRPKSKHHLLRSCRGRRPHPLPTPILILRAPRSLHSYSPWLWYDLSHRCILLRQKRTFRLHGHGLSNNGHRLPWLHRVGPPHVHRRNRRRHTSLLHIRDNDYCHSDRGKSIQLTGHPARRHY